MRHCECACSMVQMGRPNTAARGTSILHAPELHKSRAESEGGNCHVTARRDAGRRSVYFFEACLVTRRPSSFG